MKYEKISQDIFKRIMSVEREDVFNLPQLKQEKKDLEEQISTPQKRLDEVNEILGEIKKLKG